LVEKTFRERTSKNKRENQINMTPKSIFEMNKDYLKTKKPIKVRKGKLIGYGKKEW
jgi:hypothetical protein